MLKAQVPNQKALKSRPDSKTRLNYLLTTRNLFSVAKTNSLGVKGLAKIIQATGNIKQAFMATPLSHKTDSIPNLGERKQLYIDSENCPSRGY